MPVAPSFKNFEMLSEPYEANGKMYIRVRNPKTKTERQVRWYDIPEFRKLYPNEVVVSPFDRTDKEVFGFDKGYITIFVKGVETNQEWLFNSVARFCGRWGWYIVSTDEVPAEMPNGLVAAELRWEAVGEEDGRLKPSSEISRAIAALKSSY